MRKPRIVGVAVSAERPDLEREQGKASRTRALHGSSHTIHATWSPRACPQPHLRLDTIIECRCTGAKIARPRQAPWRHIIQDRCNSIELVVPWCTLPCLCVDDMDGMSPVFHDFVAVG